MKIQQLAFAIVLALLNHGIMCTVYVTREFFLYILPYFIMIVIQNSTHNVSHIQVQRQHWAHSSIMEYVMF
jgi:hypothetical protein